MSLQFAGANLVGGGAFVTHVIKAVIVLISISIKINCMINHIVNLISKSAS